MQSARMGFLEIEYADQSCLNYYSISLQSIKHFTQLQSVLYFYYPLFSSHQLTTLVGEAAKKGIRPFQLVYKLLAFIKITAMVYSSKNACTQTPSFLSIFTILLYAGVVALHSVFLIKPIIKINHAILWVIFGLHYASLLFIIWDYIWIMVHDPVDRVVLYPDLAEKYEHYQLEDCGKCGKRIKGSHHCSMCGRCTQDFDHHCKFLNNCIGKHNYEKFIRLLSMNLFFFLLVEGQCAWVLAEAIQYESVRNEIPGHHLAIIALIAVSAILWIAILILEVFHCYISLQSMTTLSYIIQNPETEEGSPGSQRRL